MRASSPSVARARHRLGLGRDQPQGAVGDVGCAEPRAVAVVARRAVEYPAEFVDGA
jgi:hypothetical protein